jgi:serine phosphatase RsbU (regulator of sigma subunit)
MKKYFLILFFLIGVMHQAFSQDKISGYNFNRVIKKIRDSTSAILSMPDSKDKAFYLYKLGGFYSLNNADSSILYYKLSEKIALDLEFKEIVPRIHSSLGTVYRLMKSNYSSALYYHTLAKKENEDLRKANEFYPEANIMMDYAYMGSISKTEKLLVNIKATALARYKQQLLNRPEDREAQGVGMIGQSYNAANEQDSAIKYSLLALEIIKAKPVNDLSWGFPFIVLGKAYLQKKEYEKSLGYIHLGMKIILFKGFQKDMAQAYECMASDYFGLNNIDSSIYYAKRSYDLGVKSSFNEVILNASQLLFKIYNQQNKFDSAFKYLQISSALKDDLALQNRINDIDNISLNETVREQEKADQEKQKNRLIIGSSLFFIISFSCYFLYNRYKQKESIRRIEEDRKNKELKAAQDFQLSMLPKVLPQNTDLDIAAYIRSSTEVGGDYYDFFEHKGKALYSICGDATGHGVASGMMVSVTKAGLNGIDALPANTILHKLNNVVKNIDLGTLRMSLNIVQIKPTEFELSSAAMPPVYHYVAATNKVEEILMEGLPLGGLREEHFDILSRSFNTGDIIVQLSDGLPEAPNLVGEMYDYERLCQLIEINGSKSAQGMIDSLIASVDSWLQGKHNPDDITLVVIKKK